MGKKWTTTYNGFYKPATTTDPLSNTTIYTYDEMANLTKLEDANGNETELSYDKLQRTTGIKDALGNEISFTYDPETNLTKLTDPLQREYSYTFNAVNQTKTFVYPDSSQESYDYDANGNLVKLTNRANDKVSYTYDDANRLTQKKYEVTSGNATTFEYSYDDANRLVGITRKFGTSTESNLGYTRNAANQLTSVIADGNTVSYTYDLAQRVNLVTYPSAEVANYEYNSRGSISAIKDGNNASIASYTYDDAGRLAKRALPNGIETIYTYNDAGWTTKIEVRETTTPTNVLQSFEYGYDNIGNRLWTKTQDGKGDVYRYDATYKITGVKYGVDDATVGYDLAANPARSVTYQYDAVGNRISVTNDGTPSTYTANALNQYTNVDSAHYSYSTRGDLTGDGIWTYGFDREGRLISANKTGTTVSYKYDTRGRRIEKSVNGTITRYVYSGYDLIEERDVSNNVTAKYIYEGGIDRPVKAIKGGNEYYFIQDVLGNVVSIVDSSGVVVEKYSFDVFGTPEIRDSLGAMRTNPMTPFLFAGREYDYETSLYHYRARAYSPSLGRFLTPDPIGFKGGIANLYCYVSNNPVNATDPLGLMEFKWHGNWGGPGWANGEWRSEEGDLPKPNDPNYVKPIDEQDACYEQHDREISNCPSCPRSQKMHCIRIADRHLRQCLNKMKNKTLKSIFSSFIFTVVAPNTVHR